MARENDGAVGVREALALDGPRAVSDGDLLTMLLGRGMPKGWPPVETLAWQTVPQLLAQGFTQAGAERLCAAFELGRRGAWHRPKPGDRCLDPVTVANLCRDLAVREAECFAVVMLDVRGRLLGREVVAQGSLTACPVNPRDVLRPAIKAGAHGLVYVHNHPSGDPSPSPEDRDLTDRMRAAAELVGLLPRDHVIVASGGYYSFVEAGRWRR